MVEFCGRSALVTLSQERKVRSSYGVGNVRITEYLRCNQLNVKVRGAYASQHTLGEAADIVPPYNQRQTPHSLHDWFEWLRSNTNFDQLILEHDSKGSYWIHVSCRRNRKANRHQVFYDLKKK